MAEICANYRKWTANDAGEVNGFLKIFISRMTPNTQVRPPETDPLLMQGDRECSMDGRSYGARHCDVTSEFSERN